MNHEKEYVQSNQNRQTGIIPLIPPQNMRKVPTSDYKLYIPWARENTANNIYPCSIAEGLQPGNIYVNDGQNIESVFFWHYCGFGYISGKPSDYERNIHITHKQPQSSRLQPDFILRRSTWPTFPGSRAGSSLHSHGIRRSAF